VLQEILDEIVDIDLVLNFKCADDCLMKKQSRSDVCSHCGQLFDASNSAYANCKPFLGNYSWHSQAEPSGVFGLGDSRMEKLRAYAKQVKFNMCQPSFTLNELGFLFVKKSHFLKLMSWGSCFILLMKELWWFIIWVLQNADQAAGRLLQGTKENCRIEDIGSPKGNMARACSSSAPPASGCTTVTAQTYYVNIVCATSV
jgi:hypothetical protein